MRSVFTESRCFPFYRPQRSWGKVMFLQAFVILFTGGEYLTPPGSRHTSPVADIPLQTRYTLEQTSPWDQVHPPKDQVHPLGVNTSWDQVHTPSEQTSPWEQVHPQEQITPSSSHSPWTRYIPQSRHHLEQTPPRADTPGADIPLPWDQVHPQTRYTPQDQVHTPPGVDTPRDQVHPPEQTPPQDQVHPLGPGTPRDQVHPRPWHQVHPPGADTLQCRACWEIRSTRGWYASYWNAILLELMNLSNLMNSIESYQYILTNWMGEIGMYFSFYFLLLVNFNYLCFILFYTQPRQIHRIQ